LGLESWAAEPNGGRRGGGTLVLKIEN